MAEIEKREPAPGYPPEEGCYLRGNDYSPVAVVVILRWIREQTPPEIEHLVRVGVESGAALSGTLQTENIGIEKVICNVVANPNIRYLIVCGPESPGHSVGDALLALARNGIDQNKRIIGATAPTPYLFNLPVEFVKRFRKQITIINLIDEGSPDVLRQAVAACYQEEPTPFRDFRLHDPGAYPEPPLSGKLTWCVTQPEREPKNEEDLAEGRKFSDLQERIRKAVAEKRRVPYEEQPAEGKRDLPIDIFAQANMLGAVNRQRVLFLCTGNSCRSHMAEGWLRKLGGERFEALSAGAKPAGYVHPLAVVAMQEVGVDISKHTSKSIDQFDGRQFDYLITVCDNAREACPHLAGARRQLHWSFNDPAQATGSEAEKMRVFRRVRDEIRERVEAFVKTAGQTQ